MQPVHADLNVAPSLGLASLCFMFTLCSAKNAAKTCDKHETCEGAGGGAYYSVIK